MTTTSQSNLEDAAVSLEQVRQLAVDLAAVAEQNLSDLLAELKRDKPTGKKQHTATTRTPIKAI